MALLGAKFASAAALVWALAIGGAAGAQPAPPAAATCAPTPAFDRDFPDPSILVDPSDGGAVFAYGTNIAPSPGPLLNVPVIKALDMTLSRWTSPIDALPKLPDWARSYFTWAPAITHRPGGPYHLYFTARYGYSGRPCIGVAASLTPEGPFIPTDETKPLVCPLSEGGAIDPSVFDDGEGGEYLLWKTDANCCEGEPAIFIQALSRDGLSLAGPIEADAPWLLPNAKPLIRRDQAWEAHVIEAPSLIKHDATYYLFYSGGGYASREYAVGYASAQTLFGPYQKEPKPILSAEIGDLNGPGGEDVFQGPLGDTWIAFHAWRQNGSSRYRALYFGQIQWTANGPLVVTTCPASEKKG